MTVTFRMVTILEGGEDLDITQEQADVLVTKNIIFKCGGCNGTPCSFYHGVEGDSTRAWEQIDAALKEMEGLA